MPLSWRVSQAKKMMARERRSGLFMGRDVLSPQVSIAQEGAWFSCI